MDGRNLEIVAFHQLTVDGSRITLPEYIVGCGFQRILFKGAEILVGMHISLALGSFQIDIERSVVHLIGSHILDALLLHDRIILRAPGNQILRISHGKLRRTGIHTPERTPGAIVRLHHKRAIHLLLAAPRTEVAGTELTYIHPAIIVGKISQMQALICRRRINEDLASGILAHDSISRRILIYRRISHTRSRSIRSSRIRSSRNLVSGSHLTDLLLHRRQCQSLRHSQQCRREE